MNDYRNIDCIMSSQQKALDKLREVSEELYQEAIQVFYLYFLLLRLFNY